MRKSAKRAIYISAIAGSAAGAVGYGRMRSKQTGVSNFSRLMGAGKKAVFHLKSQIRGGPN